MSKKIDTISEDIYDLFTDSEDHPFTTDLAVRTAEQIGSELIKATQARPEGRVKGRLWASDLGKQCLRQHHYNFNSDDKEVLDGHTRFKFLYGNVLEEVVLYYAEEAGHTVASQQDRVERELDNGWTISGRIDAVIDDVLVDVKTTSSYGYKEYATNGIHSGNDKFGYLYQLGFYAAYGDFNTERTGFVWIDKQNGHIKYTDAKVPVASDIEKRADNIVKAIEAEEKDVPKAHVPEPFGKSGNMKLPVACSYCAHKHKCWRDSNGGQGLRGFVYSHGPVWFTQVNREPKASVPEITND